MIGDNGVLTQSQQASTKTAVASFLEEVNMAYADKYSEEMEDGNFDYEVTLEDIKDKLGEEKIIAKSVSGTTYTITGYKVGTTEYVLDEEGEKFTTESPLKIPSTGSKTLEVKTNSTGGNSTRYFGLVQGGYYEMSIQNRKIEFLNENPMTLSQVNELGEATPTLSVTLKSGSTGNVSFGTPSGKTIEIIGTETTGVGTLTIGYGNATPTEIPIKVMATYTVNLYQNASATEIFKTLSVGEGEKTSNIVGYATPTAPSGKVFDKWVLKIAVGENAVGTEATSLLNNVMENLDVYATYKVAPEFGTVDEVLKEYFGRTVLSSTDITYGIAGWQLFYADIDRIYLIYADYLEKNKIPSGTNITTTNGYCVHAVSGYGREKLLNYLKTESNWESVKSAFVNKYELNSSTTGITAKGAPTLSNRHF